MSAGQSIVSVRLKKIKEALTVSIEGSCRESTTGTRM